jgi:hypothetical protein
MPRESSQFSASLAFADALGEPFQPATDKNQTFHTIARLARATREKGVEDSSPADILGAWKYPPKWGDGAIATAYFFRPMHMGIEILAGVALEADQASLRISNGPVYPIPGVSDRAELNLRVETGQRVFEHGYDLSLGDKLTAARLAVAQFAQDFFDQIA